MGYKRFLIACAMMTAASAPAYAANSYQNTCSNIGFVYAGSNAALSAMCLRADGTPNATQLVLQGISNQNGVLTQGGSGPASFQKSCGNIQIIVTGPNSLLSAICRTTAGSSNATSLSLNNISNNNGSLQQQ